MSTPSDASLTLVLGGVRSGKSDFAESLALRTAKPIFLATAEVFDEELRTRVERHRQRRGACWTTVEQPLDIADSVRQHACAGRALLVDSLGVWVGNLLHAERKLDVETQYLLESLAASRGPVIIVSDEVGFGGVSGNALARKFADQLGELNQAVAALAQIVYLVVAGIPTVIKDETTT